MLFIFAKIAKQHYIQLTDCTFHQYLVYGEVTLSFDAFSKHKPPSHLTENEAVQAVTEVGEERSYRYIRRVLSVHHTTISRALQHFRAQINHLPL